MATTSDDCCICLETLGDGETFPIPGCGHLMHAKCAAETFFRRRAECPLCRNRGTGGAGRNTAGSALPSTASVSRASVLDTELPPLEAVYGTLTGLFVLKARDPEAGDTTNPFVWEGVRCCRCPGGSCVKRLARGAARGNEAAILIGDQYLAMPVYFFPKRDSEEDAIRALEVPRPEEVRSLRCSC